MAPTLTSITKLFQTILPIGSDKLDNNQKRKLQTILLYPPEYEPSKEEIQKRWNGMIERREIEHQLILIEELNLLYKELKNLNKSGENHILPDNHDQMMAFLMALHTPPNQEIIELANQRKQTRKTQIPPETENEMNMKLYKLIIEEEPFQGDHWQTDIYAGSSSSYSGSNASSDWNSTPEDMEVEPSSNEIDQPTNSILDPMHSLAITESAEDRKSRLESYRETIIEMKKREYWSSSKKLQDDRTIDEMNAVRELLSVLQGLGADSIFCKSNSEEIRLVKNLPRLIHQSQNTSRSVYQSYIPLLSSLQKLRTMIQTFTFNDVMLERSRTLEAFVASLIGVLQRFDTFISSIELRILNLPISQLHSTLEENKIGTVISLSRLYTDLNSLGWIELFPAIASCVPKTSKSDSNQPQHPGVQSQQLLNSLYHIASHFDAYSNYPITVEESKRVFLETFEPVWSWVGSWILHGRLPGQQQITEPIDSSEYLHTYDEDIISYQPKSYLKNQDSNEFFIKQNQIENQWDSDDWWNLNHEIIENHIPKVLIEFDLEILEGGKARSLSNRLQFDQTGEIVLNLWPSLTNLLNDCETYETTLEPDIVKEGDILKSFLFHPCASQIPRSYETSSFRIGQEIPVRSIRKTDFKLELAKKLGNQISQYNQSNHQYLHTKFISSSKLKSCLIELNEFFFHDGLSSEMFINSIFEDFDEQFDSTLNPNLIQNQINSSKRWYDTQIINQNLIKSLECSNQPNFFKLCLPKIKVIKPTNKNDLQDPIKSLESLKIELSIPIPINYIINETSILKKYNLIFILLTQFSRSSKLLNRLILIKPTHKLSFINGSSFEQQIESREFYKLKNRLNWFLNLWMDYLWNLVIVKFNQKVLNRLNQFDLIELNQKVELVNDWMNKLIFVMFLSEECKPIHRIILQLLGLCNPCGEVWKSFNLQANSSTFLNPIDERYIDTERRSKKEIRRKKRIELEQYRLIDQEKEKEDELNDESVYLPTFILKRSEEEEETFYNQFFRMNEEFEKLIGLLKRSIGFLLMKRKFKKEKFKQQENEGLVGYEDEDEGNDKEDDDDEGFEEEQDGSECLMFLECRLDEWIPLEY